MADIARYLSYTDIAYREDDDDLFARKHVRIAKQDVTLTYKPKCYSMPDLLQVDTFKDSNHRHPKMQLSTHSHLAPIDVRGLFPKKTSRFKKIANCLGRWSAEKSLQKSNSRKFSSLTRPRSGTFDIGTFDPIIENTVFNGPSRPALKKRDDSVTLNRFHSVDQINTLDILGETGKESSDKRTRVSKSNKNDMNIGNKKSNDSTSNKNNVKNNSNNNNNNNNNDNDNKTSKNTKNDNNGEKKNNLPSKSVVYHHQYKPTDRQPKTVHSKTIERSREPSSNTSATNRPLRQTQRWCSENNLQISHDNRNKMKHGERTTQRIEKTNRTHSSKSSLDKEFIDSFGTRSQVIENDHYRKRSLTASYSRQLGWNKLTYQNSPSIFV